VSEDVKKIRRERFAQVVKERGAEAVADALGVTVGRVSHMKVGRKAIGGDHARDMEKALKLPAYWFDGHIASGVQESRASYHGVFLTRAGAMLAAEWEKLDVADRVHIEEEILKRVAEKKRASVRQSQHKLKD